MWQPPAWLPLVCARTFLKRKLLTQALPWANFATRLRRWGILLQQLSRVKTAVCLLRSAQRPGQTISITATVPAVQRRPKAIFLFIRLAKSARLQTAHTGEVVLDIEDIEKRSLKIDGEIAKTRESPKGQLNSPAPHILVRGAPQNFGMPWDTWT